VDTPTESSADVMSAVLSEQLPGDAGWYAGYGQDAFSRAGATDAEVVHVPGAAEAHDAEAVKAVAGQPVTCDLGRRPGSCCSSRE
jgi:hypothetical protein